MVNLVKITKLKTIQTLLLYYSNNMDDVMRLATKNKLEVIVLGDLNCDINTS